MNKKVGIIGGGQLGYMLAEAARPLGLYTIVLDPSENAPASRVADEFVVGDFKDHDTIINFSKKVDVLTFEIEHVHAGALEELATQGFPVHPTPSTLSIIKDKLRQKTFLSERGIPTPDFLPVDTLEDVHAAGTSFGYPFVLKARSGGYDGRGNATVREEGGMSTAFEKLGARELYAEKYVPFTKELASIAVRTTAGETQVYPLVETIHQNHICHMALAPAPVPANITEQARELTEKVLQSFDGAGVFAIEMFLAGDHVMVNEIAPRVHNSGHLTIEACSTSQFEHHMRAIAGMPLGSTDMTHPAAVMMNILGERNGTADPRGIQEAERIPGTAVHIYGKIETRVGRKMGHITVVADTLEEARARAEKAHSFISI